MPDTNLKTAKSTVYEMETLVVIAKIMQERNLNFSKAVNFLVKQADYLLQKIKVMTQDQINYENQENKDPIPQTD